MNSGTVQLIGTIITAAVALVGVIIAALYQFGRPQRLKLAIEVRDKVPDRFRADWDSMIDQDVQAITTSSQSAALRNWAVAFLIAGGICWSIGLYAPLPHWVRITFTLAYLPLLGVSAVLAVRYVAHGAPAVSRRRIAETLERSEANRKRSDAVLAESDRTMDRILESFRGSLAVVSEVRESVAGTYPELDPLLDQLAEAYKRQVEIMEDSVASRATRPEVPTLGRRRLVFRRRRRA